MARYEAINAKLKISGAMKLLKLNSHEKQWSKLWCWCVICSVPVSCGCSHLCAVNSARMCSNECADWNTIDDTIAMSNDQFSKANRFFIPTKIKKRTKEIRLI